MKDRTREKQWNTGTDKRIVPIFVPTTNPYQLLPSTLRPEHHAKRGRMSIRSTWNARNARKDLSLVRHLGRTMARSAQVNITPR